MTRTLNTVAATALLGLALLVSTAVSPATAAVPDAPYTDTGCDGYSDAVARLYVAAFGRTPEVDGFNFWLGEYSQANWTLPQMAEFFLVSAEFRERYGQQDDEGFVTQLYNNVLDRDPDPGGLAYWVGELEAGMSRSTMLLLFSESPENVQRSETEPPILGDFNVGASAPFECDGPDVIALCNAALVWLRAQGLDELRSVLGEDAPAGVLDAIETLQDPDAELDATLTAIESLDGYVTPVCRDRWDDDLEPAATDGEAVNLLFESIVEGDELAASAVAPHDVLALFTPWDPVEPDGDVGSPSLDYGEGDSTFNMLLAPTVTVFCEVAEGVVFSCAFGE